MLPVLLLNEMQKQQIIIEKLLQGYETINELKQTVEISNQRIQNLEESLSAA